jgi:hypothetical protein
MKKNKKDQLVDKKIVNEPNLNEVIEFENDGEELIMDTPIKKLE